MSSYLLSLPKISNVYSALSIFHKTKEKTHMTLEPLQAMIQIAFLSVLPIGTKMAISENILYLQQPSITQPLSRWYYADKKEDLYFLFQVIKRFMKWYGNGSINRDLYNLIITMANNGLNNLIKTYQTSEKSAALIQIIQIYQDILNHHDVDINEITDKMSNNIDEIFKNIISIYDPNVLSIIHNILLSIQEERNDVYINNYIDGLNIIMNKINDNIRGWIKTNLII